MNRRRRQRPVRPGLPEQRQDRGRALVGDRQRLDAQLLLGLQGLQLGARLREVGVDQVANAVGEGVGEGDGVGVGDGDGVGVGEGFSVAVGDGTVVGEPVLKFTT